ncbi:GNAT family protein [Bacillaceae bacterium S4-13-58]
MNSNDIPIIETKNYILRGLRMKDAPVLFSFMSDLEIMQYITSTPVKTVTEMNEQIHKSLLLFERKKEIPWVIMDKNNEKIIGVFRFHKLNFWHLKTEMGVVLAKTFQKKGVMTELLPHILSFGFTELGLNRIVGDIFAENEGSRKLLERQGFQKEGVLRQTDFDGNRYHDTIVYSMLRAEYETILGG